MIYLVLVIFFLWEIIQNLTGIIFILLNLKNIRKIKIYKLCFVFFLEDYIILNKKRPGNSLGRFIILDKVYWDSEYVLKHEYGHSLQSLLLGFLYLFLVMIPSYFNYRRSIYDEEFRKNYYRKYPERWANLWGGNKEE